MATFELPRLPPTIPADYEGFKVWWGTTFQPWWQQVVEKIETQEGDQAAILASLAAQLALITAAQAAADAAAADAATAATAASNAQTTANTGVTNAATAQTTANTVKRTDKISGSFTVPGAVITASDAGSNVTVTVASHTRVYGDGTQVSVNGHTFTGKAYSTDYGVYYDDTTCTDTTPSYQITATITNAQANFAAGRHRVGTVITPASGGAPSSGGTAPSGSGTDTFDRYSTL